MKWFKVLATVVLALWFVGGGRPRSAKAAETKKPAATKTTPKPSTATPAAKAAAAKKYVCPKCKKEFDQPGKCPKCKVALVAKAASTTKTPASSKASSTNKTSASSSKSATAPKK